jgi:2-alkenal reductase
VRAARAGVVRGMAPWIVGGALGLFGPLASFAPPSSGDSLAPLPAAASSCGGCAQARPVTPRGELTGQEKSVIALFEAAAPSVAYIYTETLQRSGFFTLDVARGAGSGVVWDAAGHVVTNFHVVRGASRVFVALDEGKPIPAKVVGVAEDYDLAVVQLAEVPKTLRAIPLGSSAELRIGQTVYAIGNPFGLSRTLTTGIVSALDRQMPTSQQREIAGVIQTDAAINPGNSGGPLLDSAGRLVGVNTAILSESGSSAGVGLAIPVDLVNRIVPALIEKGRAPRPGIGIVVADQSVAARLGIAGVIVLGVAAKTPAAEASIVSWDPRTGRVGDVIVAVNGKRTPSLGSFAAEIDRAGIGATVELTIVRGEDERKVKVRVVDLS